MTTPPVEIHDDRIELTMPSNAPPGAYRASATFMWTGGNVVHVDDAAIVSACAPPPPPPMSQSERQMIALAGLVLTLVIICMILEWKSKRAAAMD